MIRLTRKSAAASAALTAQPTSENDRLAWPEAVKQIARTFERHVPEVADGRVRIMAIVHDDYWAKVAVLATIPDIDPVRVCVGDERSRIQRISNELDGLKVARIDVIRWKDGLPELIVNALAPARITEVILCALLGRAVAVVPEEQLHQAIGDADGRNVRLASQLVGWDVELVTSEELDELIERAVTSFRQIPGMTDKAAESIVVEGLFCYDDLAGLEATTLAEVAGVRLERAEEIILFAKEAAEKDMREASS